MLDKKKLNNASIAYARATWNHDEHQFFCMDGFYEGANWAIDEFLKDLWHDASEEPKKDANCLVHISCEHEDTPEDNYKEYTTSMCLGGDWSEDHFPSEADVFVEKWCYLDDILPKKGGEL